MFVYFKNITAKMCEKDLRQFEILGSLIEIVGIYFHFYYTCDLTLFSLDVHSDTIL